MSKTLDEIEESLQQIETPLQKMAELQRLWAELDAALGGAVKKVKAMLKELDPIWFGTADESPGIYYQNRKHPMIVKTEELRDRCEGILKVLDPPRTGGWSPSGLQFVHPEQHYEINLNPHIRPADRS